jgi:hypothetical protein
MIYKNSILINILYKNNNFTEKIHLPLERQPCIILSIMQAAKTMADDTSVNETE